MNEPAGGSFGGLVLTTVALLVAFVVPLWWVVDSIEDPSGPRPTTSPAPASTALAVPGAAGDGYEYWASNADGSPVRWNPCAPILWVENPTGAPADVSHDLEAAMQQLSSVTGLRFEHAGVTDESPSRDRPVYQPDRYGDVWAPVLVAWAVPGENQVPLSSADRAVAIPVAVSAGGSSSFVTGQIVLNRERTDLELGFEDRAGSWGATILHELGHLAGLGHVDDPTQLMHLFPGDGPVEFGAGDLAGLRGLGADAGCLETPDPAPIEVVYEPVS